MQNIILASKSPRRKWLLKQLGLKFKVVPGNYKEDMTLKMPPAKLAEFLSFKKAEAIAKEYPKSIIISADTFVVLKGKALGKPKNLNEAKKMLKKLSGEVHTVMTGFTVMNNKQIISKSVSTKVKFRKLPQKEITNYLRTTVFIDKAGAYAVQESGGIFVERISGDYTNIIGLPMPNLINELKKIGVKI
ncbi:MAG: septum formation protein Maf [Candidatus Doudnabacteria bacterium CG10_big_fil_rev_8_21_14_0_10_42_18]|uniref:dTTP/UTP pyrophosphatase n=1 Tax=Candidatus Doudnabacteria bacterium CG10_big_fil_rev_8_21_14_0_10_42_18 TaxID=1974552 RepID=A0A2H0VBL1_9BACT|nr:MAG: septum formation protein Maf [Candidatus Doudnabacteria bacterium CG10_big_fil_rev_8_21_14_0_10_42_18]